MRFRLGNIVYWLFLLFVFLLPFEHILLIFMGMDTFFKPYRVAGMALIVCAVLLGIFKKRFVKTNTFDLALILLFVYALFISMVHYGLGKFSMSTFMNDYTQFLFLILAYLATKFIEWTPKKLHTVYVVLILAVILNALSIFIEFYFIGEFARPKGFADNPNHAAWQMVICSIYLLSLVFFRKAKGLIPILLSLGIVGFYGAAVMATGARSALVLFMLAPIVIFNIISNKNRFVFLISVLLGTIYLVSFQSDRILDFMKPGKNKSVEERTAFDRLKEGEGGSDPRNDLWKGGFKAGIDSYLLGIGIGQFRVRGHEFIINPKNYTVRYYIKKKSGLGVHSDYLALFAKTGIIGVFLYLLFLGGHFFQLAKDILNNNPSRFWDVVNITILGTLILYGIFNEGFLIPTYWLSLMLSTVSINE